MIKLLKKRRSTIALIGLVIGNSFSFTFGWASRDITLQVIFKGWYNEETWSTLRPNCKNLIGGKNYQKKIIQLFSHNLIQCKKM